MVSHPIQCDYCNSSASTEDYTNKTLVIPVKKMVQSQLFSVAQCNAIRQQTVYFAKTDKMKKKKKLLQFCQSYTLGGCGGCVVF